MFRLQLFANAALLLLLTSPVAIAQQTPDVIGVNVIGKDFEFLDNYEFQHGTSSIKGVLKTGGFQSLATITRIVPETRTRTVAYQVVIIVNGKRVVETRWREEQYTVYKPVYEAVEIDLPAVNGAWYAFGNRRPSLWWIGSVSSSGIVFGIGCRHGQTVNGFVKYFSGATPPQGTYHVTPAPDSQF